MYGTCTFNSFVPLEIENLFERSIHGINIISTVSTSTISNALPPSRLTHSGRSHNPYEHGRLEKKTDRRKLKILD